MNRYLEDPGEEAWQAFRQAYRKLLDRRYREDRAAFEELAELAGREAVYLGCSCPTKKNPRVDRCHTYLALEFMRDKFPRLEVVFP